MDIEQLKLLLETLQGVGHSAFIIALFYILKGYFGLCIAFVIPMYGLKKLFETIQHYSFTSAVRSTLHLTEEGRFNWKVKANILAHLEAHKAEMDLRPY
jgi:hypothetical protein